MHIRHEELMFTHNEHDLVVFVRVYLWWTGEDLATKLPERPEFDYTVIDLGNQDGDLPRKYYLDHQIELDRIIEDKLDEKLRYVQPEDM